MGEGGEREVKHALRKTLLRYQLHRDQDWFDRAYSYIREYYKGINLLLPLFSPATGAWGELGEYHKVG